VAQTVHELFGASTEGACLQGHVGVSDVYEEDDTLLALSYVNSLE
jgi:hypothetical protein